MDSSQDTLFFSRPRMIFRRALAKSFAELEVAATEGGDPTPAMLALRDACRDYFGPHGELHFQRIMSDFFEAHGVG